MKRAALFTVVVIALVLAAAWVVNGYAENNPPATPERPIRLGASCVVEMKDGTLAGLRDASLRQMCGKEYIVGEAVPVTDKAIDEALAGSTQWVPMDSVRRFSTSNEENWVTTVRAKIAVLEQARTSRQR